MNCVTASDNRICLTAPDSSRLGVTHRSDVPFAWISLSVLVCLTSDNSLPTHMVLATFSPLRPLIRLPTRDRSGDTIIASFSDALFRTKVGNRKASDPLLLAGNTVNKDCFRTVVPIELLRNDRLLNPSKLLHLNYPPNVHPVPNLPP